MFDGYAKNRIFIITVISILMLLCGCSKKDSEQDTSIHNNVDGLTSIQTIEDSTSIEVVDVQWKDANQGSASVIATVPDMKIIISDSIDKAIEDHPAENNEVILRVAKENVASTLASGNFPTLEKSGEIAVEGNEDNYSFIDDDAVEKLLKEHLEEIYFQILMENLGAAENNG